MIDDLDKELENLFSEEPPLPERPEGPRNKLFNSKTNLKDVDEAIERDEDEIRLNALIQSASAESPHLLTPVEIVEGEEVYDEDEAESELRQIMSNKGEVRSLDLDKDLPNVERVSFDEYILMRGIHTTLSLEFVQDEKKVPTGRVPLCIWSDAEEEALLIRKIQATPDIIYNLRYFLIGVEFKLVKDGVESELDLYHFLGKQPLGGEEED